MRKNLDSTIRKILKEQSSPTKDFASWYESLYYNVSEIEKLFNGNGNIAKSVNVPYNGNRTDRSSVTAYFKNFYNLYTNYLQNDSFRDMAIKYKIVSHRLSKDELITIKQEYPQIFDVLKSGYSREQAEKDFDPTNRNPYGLKNSVFQNLDKELENDSREWNKVNPGGIQKEKPKSVLVDPDNPNSDYYDDEGRLWRGGTGPGIKNKNLQENKKVMKKTKLNEDKLSILIRKTLIEQTNDRLSTANLAKMGYPVSATGNNFYAQKPLDDFTTFVLDNGRRYLQLPKDMMAKKMQHAINLLQYNSNILQNKPAERSDLMKGSEIGQDVEKNKQVVNQYSNLYLPFLKKYVNSGDPFAYVITEYLMRKNFKNPSPSVIKHIQDYLNNGDTQPSQTVTEPQLTKPLQEHKRYMKKTIKLRESELKKLIKDVLKEQQNRISWEQQQQQKSQQEIQTVKKTVLGLLNGLNQKIDGLLNGGPQLAGQDPSTIPTKEELTRLKEWYSNINNSINRWFYERQDEGEGVSEYQLPILKQLIDEIKATSINLKRPINFKLLRDVVDQSNATVTRPMSQDVHNQKIAKRQERLAQTPDLSQGIAKSTTQPMAKPLQESKKKPTKGTGTKKEQPKGGKKKLHEQLQQQIAKPLQENKEVKEELDRIKDMMKKIIK